VALLTEAQLRRQFGDTGEPGITCYELPAGTIVTPSARAWLTDHRIDLIVGQVRVTPKPAPDEEPSALPAFIPPSRFDVIDGSQIETKPEHLTALRGNLLVPKNHPQIRFRGQLDALEADIVAAELVFDRLGLSQGLDDLRQVMRYVKEILRAEVLDVPFETPGLFGLSDAQLREQSHHPRRTYGITHFAASCKDGEAVVVLNQLRTRARQAEIAAYDAFSATGVAEPTRIDIIQALNRLSSAFYLMMFRTKTGVYQ